MPPSVFGQMGRSWLFTVMFFELVPESKYTPSRLLPRMLSTASVTMFSSRMVSVSPLPASVSSIVIVPFSFMMPSLLRQHKAGKPCNNFWECFCVADGFFLRP